jgi:transcriptional regulator with XRE-family HTH domain
MSKPNSFGTYLHSKRTAAGLKLVDVAKRLTGVTDAYLAEVERGTRVPLPREQWPALVTAIPGVTMAALEHHSEIASAELEAAREATNEADPSKKT